YLNVTIPHKNAAAALATSRSPAVRAAGAANTLIFSGRGSSVRAENTDGVGMLAALADLGADEPRGRVAVVVGSGGAAAGAIEALGRAGARIRVVARRPAAARALRGRVPAVRRRAIAVFPWDQTGLATALHDADLLVSAVPAAAWDDGSARAGLAALPAGKAVLEMAYGADTPLARAIAGRGMRYADGLGMLVHQAAYAIKLALGTAPPVAPLFRAARQPGPSVPVDSF
ncbi:MAG TPA: NAD(P)-dependent oxidoreductase, partial [Polyangia bacterium]|nr:NAD(P)-dependent oxidoreductase [Polyangia bacterium]